MADQTPINLKAIDHLKPKVIKEPETEWQKAVKTKKTEGYYNQLSQLESEQILKETKLREESHQYAVPGQRVIDKSVTRGMAQNYEESL